MSGQVQRGAHGDRSLAGTGAVCCRREGDETSPYYSGNAPVGIKENVYIRLFLFSVVPFAGCEGLMYCAEGLLK